MNTNNAPDKIYLGIKELDTGYVYALSLDNNGEQEYIHKDALLEWLNKTAAEYKKRSDEGELVWQNWCAYIDVIKHLNEM